MFTRILVPLDGSLCAEQAIPVVVRIVRASHGSITLLRNVLAPMTWTDMGQSPWLLQEIMEAEHTRAVQYLDVLARSPMLESVATKTNVVYGSVTQSILDVIQTQQIDLLVMCAGRGSAFNRWDGGSITQQVVRYTTVPALLLQHGSQMQFGSSAYVRHHAGKFVVLIALDGSSYAESALLPAASFAAALAAPSQGTLHLLRVVTLSGTSSRRTERRILQEATQYLSTVADQLRQMISTHPFTGLNLRVTWSIELHIDVAKGIIRVAEQGQIIKGTRVFDGSDLIVMTSHGRTGLQRWVMGSVTERVLRMTRLPLLIIRPLKDVVANNEEYRGETSEPEVPLWSGQVHGCTK